MHKNSKNSTLVRALGFIGGLLYQKKNCYDRSDNRTRHFVTSPRRIPKTVQAELNLFAVQMLARSPRFCVFDLFVWYDYPLAENRIRKSFR